MLVEEGRTLEHPMNQSLKGKIEGTEGSMPLGQGMSNKSRYKKLKMPVFAGENSRS